MRSIQQKEAHDASKEASNQQLYVCCVPGSSIGLSFISNTDKQSKAAGNYSSCLKPHTNRTKGNLWPVFEPCCPYSTWHSLWTANMNEAKRSFKYSTAHGLSTGTYYMAHNVDQYYIRTKGNLWPVFDPCCPYSTWHSLWTANMNEAKRSFKYSTAHGLSTGTYYMAHNVDQ